jgi:hypothetical protein
MIDVHNHGVQFAIHQFAGFDGDGSNSLPRINP